MNLRSGIGIVAGSVAVVFSSAAQALTLAGDGHINAGGQLIVGGSPVATAASGDGSQTNPFVFVIGGDLDLHGYQICGNTNNTLDQHSATWQVSGNVTNSSGGGSDGSFYSHGGDPWKTGGCVRIEAGGSIAVKHVWTWSNYQRTPGNIYLWAKAGSVKADGNFDTRASGGLSFNSGSVTVRSEGDIAHQGIAVGKDGAWSIRTDPTAGGFEGNRGGDICLYTEGDVSLAGGILALTLANSAGSSVLIRGKSDDPSKRAGNVSVGGDVRTWRNDSYAGGSAGNFTVLAASLGVASNVLTYSRAQQAPCGDVDIDVTGDVTIGGYIDTHSVSNVWKPGACGRVEIDGKHIAINGADTNGVSIMTDPLDYDAAYGSQANDGDVILRGTDSSLLKYNPNNPTNGPTSSISVAGKIQTGYGGDANTVGRVYIYAVEVRLGGAISTESATLSDIAIHYGVTTYGIVTHLVEYDSGGGSWVRWDGVSGHKINYGVGPTTFTADVPYAGLWNPPGTIFTLH